MSNSKKKYSKYCALQQHCYAAYRNSIFDKILSCNSFVEFKIFFGSKPSSSSVQRYDNIFDIPNISYCHLNKIVYLKNKWIYKDIILWQTGLLKEVSRRNISSAIFEGCPWHISTWVALIVCKLLGKKSGLWSHGLTKPSSFFRKIVFRIFFGLGDFLLIYGLQGRNNLTKIGICPSKIYPIHNSLDYHSMKKIQLNLKQYDIKKLRDSLFVSPQYPIFFWLGRVHSKRRLDLFIKAAAKLHQDGNKVNILIAGPVEKNEKTNLLNLIDDLNLNDWVVFYGPSYDEKNNAMLFSMSSATVSPGPIGLTCIHSLTYGIPIITNNPRTSYQLPEADAILDKITGKFYEYEELESLRDAMMFFMNLNREEKKRISFIADKVIRERFSPDYQIKVIEDALAGNLPSGWNWKKKFNDSFEQIHSVGKIL